LHIKLDPKNTNFKNFISFKVLWFMGFKHDPKPKTGKTGSKGLDNPFLKSVSSVEVRGLRAW